MTSPEFTAVPSELLSTDEWQYLEDSLPRFEDGSDGPVYVHQSTFHVYGLLVSTKESADGSVGPTLNVYQFSQVGGDVVLHHIDIAQRSIEVYDFPYEKLMGSGSLAAVIEEVQFQQITGGSVADETKVTELKSLIKELRDQEDEFRLLMGED